MKKRYGTTDFLRKYCYTMIKRAEEYNDTKTINLFKAILKVLDEFDV